jgi:hypothetical protein
MMKHLVLAAGIVSAVLLAAPPAYAIRFVPPSLADVNLRTAGSGSTEVQIFYTFAGVTYAMDISVKDSVISASVINDCGGRAQSVRLKPEWIDHLHAGLKAAAAHPSAKGIPCALTYVSDEGHRITRAWRFNMPEDFKAADTLREIARLYSLDAVVVQPGDTLSSIAQKRLGSAKRYPEILAVNPGLNERHLVPGTRLRLPDDPSMDTMESDEAVVSKKSPTKAVRPLRPGEMNETDEVADELGFDYRQTTQAALAHDRLAMHLMLWMTHQWQCDGAAAEGHAAVLGILMRRMGDKFFARSLAMETGPVRRGVRDTLFCLLGDRDGGLAKLSRDFPQTFPKSYEFGPY